MNKGEINTSQGGRPLDQFKLPFTGLVPVDQFKCRSYNDSMKSIGKLFLVFGLVLALLTLGTSCSNSSGKGDGGGDEGDPKAVGYLVSSWGCTRYSNISGVIYFEDYYYYLYSDNHFAYKIISQTGPSTASEALYTGRWENYAGTYNHTYHFTYSTSSDRTEDTWGDLNASGSAMTVYTTDNRTKLDSLGNAVSSQWPADDLTFNKQ